MQIASSGGTTNIVYLDDLSSPASPPSDPAADFLLPHTLLITSTAADGGSNGEKAIVFNAKLVMEIVGILALVLVIVVGNGMVMLAVRLDRTILALSQSSFLFSLALADALVGVFVLPMALVQIVYEYWPLPPIICILYRCLDVALCTASILHLCAISMDRFWSLRLDYTRQHRSRNMRIMIVVVWLLSLVICLPSALPSKFDLHYLGNYLPSSGDDDDNEGAASFASNFFISPFYILDTQQQQQQQQSDWAQPSTPSPTALTVFFQPPTPSAVTLPARPHGNNKVLQSLDDAGGVECIGPTPFDWLFPPYDDTANSGNDPARTRQPCQPSSSKSDVTTASSSASSFFVMPPAPAVLSDAAVESNLSLGAGSPDDSGEDIGLYHCALINDIFYTFASASMSFYIPLIITIIMNVLTFWIARKTAKSAIKKSGNPAALMLRAILPTIPAGRPSTTFSETYDPRDNSTFGDGYAVSPTSAVEFVDEKERNESRQPGDKSKQSDGDIDNSRTATSSNNEAVKAAIEPTSVENNRLLAPVPNCSVVSRSFQPRQIRKSLFQRVKNGNIKRSVSCKNRAVLHKRDKTQHAGSFDHRVTVTDDLLSEEQTQQPTKSLMANVLQNVTFFGRQSAVSKPADDFDRTVHTVRAEKKRRAKQRERKAALVLIIVTVTFIVCWLPFFTIFPLTKVFEPGVIPGQVFEAAVWLGYVNSAVNPVIYTIFNEEFRRAFTNIFLCRWKQFGR